MKYISYKEGSTLRAALPHVFLVVAYFLYLLFGGLCFMFMERNLEEEFVVKYHHDEEVVKTEIQEAFVNNTVETLEDLKELLEKVNKVLAHPDYIAGRLDVALDDKIDEWSLPSSMVFCMTTITTIGYGDMIPATTVGKVFTVVYSLLGVPFSFLILADIGGLLALLAVKISRSVRCKLIRYGICKPKGRGCFHSMEQRMEGDIPDDGIAVRRTSPASNGQMLNMDRRLSLAGSFHPEIQEEYDDVPLVAVVIFITLYIMCGALGFCLIEDWSYSESLWFVFITLTTIGFGDLVPIKHYENNLYIICLLFTLAGLCFMSMTVTILRKKFDRLLDFSSIGFRYCLNGCKHHTEYEQQAS